MLLFLFSLSLSLSLFGWYMCGNIPVSLSPLKQKAAKVQRTWIVWSAAIVQFLKFLFTFLCMYIISREENCEQYSFELGFNCLVFFLRSHSLTLVVLWANLTLHQNIYIYTYTFSCHTLCTVLILTYWLCSSLYFAFAFALADRKPLYDWSVFWRVSVLKLVQAFCFDAQEIN